MAVIRTITHYRKVLISWEARSLSDGRDIFDDFRHQKTDNRTHKCLPEVPVLRLMIPVHIITNTSRYFKIHFNITTARKLGSLMSSLSLNVPKKKLIEFWKYVGDVFSIVDE